MRKGEKKGGKGVNAAEDEESSITNADFLAI